MYLEKLYNFQTFPFYLENMSSIKDHANEIKHNAGE